MSRRQLRALGFTDSVVANRVATSAFLRVAPAVYAAGHDRLTIEGRWMAAVLSSGPGAVLSHRAAGGLWGLSKPVALVEVTVPRENRHRSRPGLRLHRSKHLAGTDVTSRHAIAVTRPQRTLLDLAEVLPGRALERALDEAHRLRLCSESQLVAAVAHHPGRAGAARLGRLLAEHDAGSTATENDFEELFLSISDEHGIPRPRCQEWLLGYRVDFLWRAQRVVVETDGRGSHTTRRAFERDHTRDNELATAGWAVRRFTWRQLTEQPGWVAAEVRHALARLPATSIEKSHKQRRQPEAAPKGTYEARSKPRHG